MNDAAQATNGVNGIFFTQVVGREYGSHGIDKLPCEFLYCLIIGIRYLGEGVASREFSSIEQVGRRECEDGVAT